ncbi:hypothetical protein OIU77_018300 [Salix suchowensis]|uniref:Uncharacterized protein n=1 Tax=Salix suchowensis TaxID=1278906 RepID=A0ABQ8ZTA6_9ROSI|nr:hypothetical protein OIU77_018300 [Salix suchowensis]
MAAAAAAAAAAMAWRGIAAWLADTGSGCLEGVAHEESLGNIENMWGAEPKHPNEQKKLTEIGKQIQDERERSEFRLLQEQAEHVRVEWEKVRKSSDIRSSKHDDYNYKALVDSDGESSERENPRGRNDSRDSKYRKQSPHGLSNPRAVEEDVQDAHRKNHGKSMNERYLLEGSTDFVPCRKERSMKNPREGRSYVSAESVHHDSIYKCQSVAS